MYGPKQISTGNYATVVGIFMEQYKNNKEITVVRPQALKLEILLTFKILFQASIKASSINLNHEWFFRSGKSISIIELAEMFGKWVFIPERKGKKK